MPQRTPIFQTCISHAAKCISQVLSFIFLSFLGPTFGWGGVNWAQTCSPHLSSFCKLVSQFIDIINLLVLLKSERGTQIFVDQHRTIVRIEIASSYHLQTFSRRNLPFSGRTISDFTYFRIGISAVNHPGKPEIPARLVFLYAQHRQSKYHKVMHSYFGLEVSEKKCASRILLF